MSTPERTRRRRRRTQTHPSSKSVPPIPQPKSRLTFLSPRIETPDPILPPLHSPEARFRYISTVAGPHCQDGASFRVRPQDPQALRLGMPQSAGARVKTLWLPMVPSERLPEWLDAVSTVCPNLLHLHIPSVPQESVETQVNDENQERVDITPSEESKVRRLYVLYRLPKLLTMDGTAFTPRERMLSRPQNTKLSSKKTKFSRKSSTSACLLDNESEDEDSTTVVSLKTRKAIADSAVEVGRSQPQALSSAHFSFFSSKRIDLVAQKQCRPISDA